MPKDTSGADGAFKHQIDTAAVERLAAAFVAVAPSFPSASFRQVAGDGLASLELKARVSQVAVALQASLPSDFSDASAIVDRVLAGFAVDPATEWLFLWPVTDWVARAGLGSPPRALELLARLTPYSTGEFAVRPFIDQDPGATLARFAQWVDRDDEHVRRLVSEGTRPRLPWAARLAVAERDPGYAVALLDRLVADPSEYVRRSVSNHLNDLCKADRSLSLHVATRWTERAAVAAEVGDVTTEARIRWVVRRGIRTLIKAGDGDAMRLLGHDPDAVVAARLELHTPDVVLGGAAEWMLELTSDDAGPQRVVVDYAIHFLRANGSAGRKVFKWTTIDLAPGQQVVLQRRHPIVPITIRTYRSGRHVVEVQVNGVVVATDEFDLQV